MRPTELTLDFLKREAGRHAEMGQDVAIDPPTLLLLVGEIERLRAIKSAEVAAEILGEVRSG